MAKLILPGVNTGGANAFAKALNRVVKEFRGASRPFLTLVVETDGKVSVLSNMDKHPERIDLLRQVTQKLLGN